jgi:radical SAM protein with 4Fe4S-binding SPASM domain
MESYAIEKYQAVIDQVVAQTDYQIDIKIQLPPALARKRFFCHSLANYLCVSPNGTLAPCCHMPWDAKYGNFIGATENPINHPAIVNMRNQFMAAAASQDLRLLPEQCRHCNKRTPKNHLFFKANTQKWKNHIKFK